ncbi:hypothetical protein CAPI_08335 [Corynebacterium capitovis DSM 44611]|uniref:hypothetical protein n=1 Tax=Corynebacterium capitovis TaxID=131081 RepID=UPI0003786E43|nr:hypothetical protein [Corynebacterium capitovis]WKD58194.1 hypothetical protein CAPI_08335 [Corynebacterium capitovis DSM 44611]
MTMHAAVVTQTRDPLQERYRTSFKLPRPLHEEATGMDWGLFMATYAPAPTLQVALVGVEKSCWAKMAFRATVTKSSKLEAPHTEECEVTATGPVAAVSELLAEHGRYVEVASFHQIELHEATLTCVRVRHQAIQSRESWAIGFGSTPAQSVAAALSSGAQRIYGNL